MHLSLLSCSLLEVTVRLLLATSFGYGLVGVYVWQMPRFVNLWAASLTVKGQARFA